MPKILVDENIPLIKDALIADLSVDSISGRQIDNALLIAGNYDALIVRSITKVNQELLDGTSVRLVGTATSGTDHIEEDYLKSNKIQFASAPGSNANSVAEYVVYSILSHSKAYSTEIIGKTIGIVGFGNIGRIVADYSRRMGLNVLVNDPPLKDAGFEFPEYVHYTELCDLLESSDIITNHVPLTGEGKYPTINLFNEKNIKTIRNSTLFINCSRGGVTDEQALLAKVSKRELVLASDVWENEPLVNDLLVRYCFLATPHIAGYSYDGKLKGALMMAEAIEQHFGVSIKSDLIKQELENSTSKYRVDDNHSLIHGLLENTRKLSDDYKVFLNSMLMSETDRKREFDRLRKEYPRRREILY